MVANVSTKMQKCLYDLIILDFMMARIDCNLPLISGFE